MPIQILFGTETGTAEDCAHQLAQSLDERGIRADVVDMDRVRAAELARPQVAVVITSTFGNGDPPLNAEALLEGLRSERPDLSELWFAVLALGDSTFEHFAKCGRDFDAILGELGGRRLLDRVDVDGDPGGPLGSFRDQLFDALGDLPDAAPPSEPVPRDRPSVLSALGKLFVTFGSGRSRSPGPDRTRPAAGRLVSRRLLTSPDSSGETHHYVLDLG
ncbi:MAG: flavodoxin domain-containing protein, partial [Myxococcota bacterium]